MIDFIRLKSYHNTDSVGEVQIIGGDDMTRIMGKVNKFLNYLYRKHLQLTTWGPRRFTIGLLLYL